MTTQPPPLRIALFVPQLGVSGGLGVYCRSALEGLLRAAGPDETFLVLAPTNPRKLFPHSGLDDGWKELVADPRVQLVPLEWPQGFALSGTMDTPLAGPMTSLRADVLHCTYYTGMAKPPCRQLITFHDSGFLENPGTFGDTARLRREAFAAMGPNVHRLVFTTGDARDRVCRLLPFDPARTEIVNLSLADRPETLADAQRAEWLREPLWPGGETIVGWGAYLFVPVGAATGFNRIRKNVPTAVAAFRACPPAGTKMIIASTGILHGKLLAELLPDSELAKGRMVGDAWRSGDDAIHVLPNLERTEFLAAMARARAIVYPTRFEGFGLPSVEAMALGVPLIAGNATAVPEVVGDAGILVDPDDVAGFTNAYHRVLTDAALTADLVRRGKARVERFTLDRLGQEMLAVYRRAVL